MNSFTSNFKLKKTLYCIIGLIIGFFIFDRSLYYMIYQGELQFYRQPDFSRKFNSYIKQRRFSTLIMGTSRTYEALHPAYFRTFLNENAFKEAQFGKNPKYNYLFYKFFKKAHGTPRVVIYGIDYFIFNSSSRKRWLARMGAIHSSQTLFSAPSLLFHNKNDIEDFINRLQEHFDELLSFEQTDGNIKDLYQVQEYLGTPAEPGKVKTKRPRHLKRQRYRRFPGKEGIYLKKLLQETEKDKVTTILVLLPDYYGTYRTNYNQRRLLKDLRNLTRGMKHTHVLNFNHPDRFPLTRADYFINGGWGMTNSHMSESGAKHFNRIFIDSIKKFYHKKEGALSFR